MATIRQQVDATDFIDEIHDDGWLDVEIDVEVDDFFDEMSDREKEIMVTLLENEGYLDDYTYEPLEENEITLEGHKGYTADLFRASITKLTNNYISLPRETIEAVINLAQTL